MFIVSIIKRFLNLHVRRSNNVILDSRASKLKLAENFHKLKSKCWNPTRFCEIHDLRQLENIKRLGRQKFHFLTMHRKQIEQHFRDKLDFFTLDLHFNLYLK